MKRIGAWVGALLGLVGFLVPGASPAQAPPGAPLTVHVAKLRSNAGQVGCTIYDGPKGFPTDHTAARQQRWCPIDKQSATCTFGPLGAGVYAVACFHDENGNGKMDTGLFGIPTEGTVVSNNAKGFMGPPSFEKARFSFGGVAAEMTLPMGY